jgi:phage shock protein A
MAAGPSNLGEPLDMPEKTLRLAIRELEVSIAEATFETAQAMARARTLGRKLELNREACEQWQQQAVAAVATDDEAAARMALLRRHEQERAASVLEQQLEAAGQASVTLRQHLDGLRGELRDARRRLASVCARQPAGGLHRWMGTPTAELHGEDGEVACFQFQRWEERPGQGDGKPQTMTEPGDVDPPPGGATDGVAPQEDRDVTAELMELRRQLGK